MKKSVVILFAAVALFSLAQVAGADTITFLGGPWQSSGGGEFTLQPLPSNGTLASMISSYAPTTKNQLSGSNFQSFCLEEHEYISAGVTYNAVLNYKAVQGGVGPAGDPISQGTAWLYQQFAQGTLPGYAYNNAGGTRPDSAGELQNAIWYLEGEGGSLSANYSNKLIAQFGSVANAELDNIPGGFNVWALNLYNLDGTLAQDQLIWNSSGITVPEPGSLLLLGFGLLGLFGAARRRVK